MREKVKVEDSQADGGGVKVLKDWALRTRATLLCGCGLCEICPPFRNWYGCNLMEGGW